MAKEQASNAINSAIQLAQIQKNGAEEFRLKMIDLENQFKNNQISESEYKIKVAELNAEFLNTSDALDKAKTSTQNFADYINKEKLISTKSWDELNNSIKGIGDSYNTNKKSLESSYESQKSILEKQQLDWSQLIEFQNQKLENLKQNGKEETQEYKDAEAVLEDYKTKYGEVANNIGALNKQQKEDTRDLKKVTVEALLEIVASLKQSGYDMKKDSNETVKEINKILKKLGIKDEVNLSKNMDDIVTQINKQLGTDVPKTVSVTNKILKQIGENVNPVVKVKADTSSASKTVQDWAKGLALNVGILFKNSIGGHKANGGVYSNGSWKNIPQYANGGVPSHGSMFIAGERGAEIVGHINGKTEVLNQSQIASAIYSAVASAMSQYAGGGIAEINVHADKGIIVETAVNGIQQHVNQTGTLPFEIPAQ